MAAEVRSSRGGSKRPGILERISERSDACCGWRGRQANFAANAMGTRALVGEGYQSWVLVDQSVEKAAAFRDAWKRGQRCLVVTDGFYEWKEPEKQPYAIGMADDDLMVMAGLWDEWKSPKGEHVKSCTIITCPPNKVAALGF
jgi:hypothetical protein